MGYDHIIAVVMGSGGPLHPDGWGLMLAGAADVLYWTDLHSIVSQIKARFQRKLFVDNARALYRLPAAPMLAASPATRREGAAAY